MKSLVVIKIGGSCLTNGEELDRLINKIKKLNESSLMPIVVVSAVSGLTDLLLNFIGDAKNNGHPDLVDGVLAQGEITSAKLLDLKLNSMGIHARAILPDEEFPIMTNENHGDADILVSQTRDKLRRVLLPLLNKNIVPIVPGFIGITHRGKITTLGRGGSDTTAAAIGASIDAIEVVLLKDVDGLFDIDPKKGNAKLIPKIHASEALKMSLSGAKVIHHKAFLVKGSTPIRIVNKNEEDMFKKGTLITGDIND